MDEDMFTYTALHPFLDIVFPVGHDLIKHDGQLSYRTDSKQYKSEVRYSVNSFDLLALEVKIPGPKLDDTEKLTMQLLKHMLHQRVISAGYKSHQEY
ncbi:hypothetical protein PS15m_007764 [Mucor circinelloides]